MQFILFLLGLFAIGCVLYGIHAGVRAIARGAAWLADSGKAVQTSREPPAGSHLADAEAAAASPPPAQRCIAELQALFGLHQSGALTREEFDQLKHCLLSSIDPSTARTRQENA